MFKRLLPPHLHLTALAHGTLDKMASPGWGGLYGHPCHRLYVFLEEKEGFGELHYFTVCNLNTITSFNFPFPAFTKKKKKKKAPFSTQLQT